MSEAHKQKAKERAKKEERARFLNGWDQFPGWDGLYDGWLNVKADRVARLEARDLQPFHAAGFDVPALSANFVRQAKAKQAADTRQAVEEAARRDVASKSTYWEVAGAPAGWDSHQLEAALGDGGWEVEALPSARARWKST